MLAHVSRSCPRYEGSFDIPTVFGAGSPEAQEVAANPGQAFADFVGIGVHCAQGSAVCSQANHSITSRRDALAAQMIALLEGAAFNGQVINEHQAKGLIDQGNALLQQVAALAAGS